MVLNLAILTDKIDARQIERGNIKRRKRQAEVVKNLDSAIH